MDHELPENLESTRGALAASLQLYPSELAPALPLELLNDLCRRSTAAAPARVEKRSWFAAVQSFIARPAFGVAAVAVVILAVGVPTLMKQHSPADHAAFRGAAGPVETAPDVRILLVQAPAGIRQELERSGDFETGAISAIADRTAVTGAAVIVDFETATITALDASGRQISSAALPADPVELSAAIATAVSGL